MSLGRVFLLASVMLVRLTKVIVRYVYPFADHSSPVLIEDLWTSLVRLCSMVPDRGRLGPACLSHTILRLEGAEGPKKRLIVRGL